MQLVAEFRCRCPPGRVFAKARFGDPRIRLWNLTYVDAFQCVTETGCWSDYYGDTEAFREVQGSSYELARFSWRRGIQCWYLGTQCHKTRILLGLG